MACMRDNMKFTGKAHACDDRGKLGCCGIMDNARHLSRDPARRSVSYPAGIRLCIRLPAVKRIRVGEARRKERRMSKSERGSCPIDGPGDIRMTGSWDTPAITSPSAHSEETCACRKVRYPTHPRIQPSVCCSRATRCLRPRRMPKLPRAKQPPKSAPAGENEL